MEVNEHFKDQPFFIESCTLFGGYNDCTSIKLERFFSHYERFYCTSDCIITSHITSCCLAVGMCR